MCGGGERREGRRRSIDAAMEAKEAKDATRAYL